jgi:hypothetical protein
MAEPFLDHVKSDSLADGGNAAAVPQAFRTGVSPLTYSGGSDNILCFAPSRHAAPGPERFIEPSAAFFLDLADAMDHVDGVDEIGWDRHSEERAAPTFLQAFKNDDLTG